jgi:molybdopterin/thiamine biosynthesis adenylyltransferase
MTITLAVSAALAEELNAALADRREVAGVLAARVVDGPDGRALLGRSIVWAPPDAYLDRRDDGLALGSTGWVPAARAALAEGSTPVFVHTHPGGRAEFSARDDRVDHALRATFTALGGDPYASLVLAGDPSRPAATARVDVAGALEPVAKIRIVGDRLRILSGPTGDPAAEAEVFDRQIRVFGAAGQQVLTALHVAVVGAGGTGSAVAEQLARLGVGSITIVDDDLVTEPTPTRGYGTTVADLGRPKAEVVAAHLRDVGLGTRTHAITASVQDAPSRYALASADAVFSCVDGHGARLLLNRWAYAHLAPVIDLAVLVSANDAAITGIDGRVTWLAPGAACLLCRGRLDPVAAYAEVLAPEERRRLAGEGYVAHANTRQPAVVTLTSLVASLGTTELLNRLFGLADPLPTEILALAQQRELRRNRLPQRPGCFCSDSRFLGRGAEQPYLDLMWPD